jgi:TatD DNase family protein
MIFDTHAHYTFDQFAENRLDFLRNLQHLHSVAEILIPGVDLSDSEKALEIADALEGIHTGAGVHPSNAFLPQTSDLDRLDSLLRQDKCVALGEVGLDYHYEDNPPSSTQKALCQAQLELAAVHHLPVIFHDRDAHEDSLQMVRQFPGLRGVFHCFSGDLVMAQELLTLGWKVSFTGNVTFKSAQTVRDVASALPLDSFFLETDAPYMAPVPNRSKRCDSSMIPLIASEIARVRHVTTGEVLQATFNNGVSFFGIPKYRLHSSAQ